MLRRTALVAFAPTAVALNFFPLGRSSGPKVVQKVLPVNLYDASKMSMPKLVVNSEAKTRNYVPRNQLRLQCSCCEFYWHHDALAVRCSANPSHKQRESWLPPTWIRYNRNALNFQKYLIANIHPRTGAMLNREDAPSRNNERRGAGYSTRNMRYNKEMRTISRKASGAGAFSTAYYAKYPLPT